MKKRKKAEELKEELKRYLPTTLILSLAFLALAGCAVLAQKPETANAEEMAALAEMAEAEKMEGLARLDAEAKAAEEARAAEEAAKAAEEAEAQAKADAEFAEAAAKKAEEAKTAATGGSVINVGSKQVTIPGLQTYVLIKLSEQTLWVVRSPSITDNLDECEILFETGIVTGTAKTSRSTPTGTYQIYSKVKGTYLRPSDGSKVWVDYWMPFNGGIGLHDATWRSNSQFGTDQYLYSGSHGCVNMPYDSAATVYDLVSVGTTVYVVN